MLKSFEISNFKSFKNKTKFDMEKTNYQMLSATNVKGELLKGVMFVGANASGKSNSIFAIKFLLDCLFGRTDINIAGCMCLFSDNPIMSLMYTFDIEESEIIYNIEYQRIDNRIEEVLIMDGRELLHRDGSVATVNITNITQHTDVPKDTLFLRDVYFNTKFSGNEKLQKWFRFLSNSIYVDLYSRSAIQYKDIDLSLNVYLEEEGAQKINSFFQEYNFGQTIEYDNKSIGNTILMESDEKKIIFKREGIDEPIPLIFESLGNRTLLNLLPAFFTV